MRVHAVRANVARACDAFDENQHTDRAEGFLYKEARSERGGHVILQMRGGRFAAECVILQAVMVVLRPSA